MSPIGIDYRKCETDSTRGRGRASQIAIYLIPTILGRIYRSNWTLSKGRCRDNAAQKRVTRYLGQGTGRRPEAPFYWRGYLVWTSANVLGSLNCHSIAHNAFAHASVKWRDSSCRRLRLHTCPTKTAIGEISRSRAHFAAPSRSTTRHRNKLRRLSCTVSQSFIGKLFYAGCQ